MQGSGDGELKHLIMSNLLYLIGLFTFALLIGIVSDAVSEKVEDVRHGNHQVLERVRSCNQLHAHCLLLRLESAIAQLAVARGEQARSIQMGRLATCGIH
jgi:hypothetical protein